MEAKLNSEYSVIIATAPDSEAAEKIANLLVSGRLAACAQLFPIRSIYFWQEKLRSDNEVMLIIKSKTALFDKIKAAITDNHPYEVPEIIQIPITDGLPEYLKWIVDTCSG